MNIFQRRWPPWLMCFRNYVFRNTWLDKCLKSPVSEEPGTGNMVNRLKHCFSINDSTFTIFNDHCEGNWVQKSLLVTCKIIRLLLNTTTVDYKYCPLNRDNSTQSIQMHLSHKQKTFSQNCWAFLKPTLNFEHFKKRRPS